MFMCLLFAEVYYFIHRQNGYVGDHHHMIISPVIIKYKVYSLQFRWNWAINWNND